MYFRRLFLLVIFLGFFVLLVPHSTFAAPIRILIVPGHDDIERGTEFLGVKESDMNEKLALYLRDKLATDPNFEVMITRDWSGYMPIFADYFSQNADMIKNFITNAHNVFATDVTEGKIQKLDGMPHNEASDRVVNILYGINKWVSENDVDAVVHVHFNDYPRPKTSARGKYGGFVVYTPDQQLGNGPASLPLAMSVYASLSKQYPTSNYLKETAGVTMDQDLIAVGSNNTLKTRAILIEYGYIYEKKFSTFAKREKEFKIMARLTYDGIKRYFDIVKIIPEYGALK